VAIATVNPATGETVKTYDEMSEADVERSLAAAAAAVSAPARRMMMAYFASITWLLRGRHQLRGSGGVPRVPCRSRSPRRRVGAGIRLGLRKVSRASH